MPTQPPFSSESPKSPQQPGQRRKWNDYIEEQITEAQKRGDFDNLPGAGKPLRIEKNVFAGDKALAYSLLKNNQLAPPEIERAKEIDAAMARAEELLVTLRRRRDTLRLKLGRAFASDRRAYNLLRNKTRARYDESLRAINSNVLSLNIIVPPALHRRLLDVDAKLRVFDDEFPRLAE
ncbi:MAG TPA: DnaJ family domain-containing protein [Ktedonobacterales bacterium]|nr:DnaJ family domain-containing protein [Ktedonobacterales bacterium]